MKVKHSSRLPAGSEAGFTIIELLVAIAIGLVILAGIFRTFKAQQDSYVVQDQVAAMQQNLRAAMYLITRDLQMAGWYTNFDRSNHNIDWNDLDSDQDHATGPENWRPLVIPHDNNSTAGDGVRDGTDMLIVVKASDGSGRLLSGSETAGGTSVSIDLAASGLNSTTNRYGLLVKNDLRTADLFIAGASPNPWSLSEDYLSGDTVFRTDLIVYRINEDADHPTLQRGNLGAWNGYQTVAENIDNLQVRYYLQDDPVPKDTLTLATQHRVRAVEVILVGRTASPQRGFRDTETYNFANNPNPTPNDNYRRKVLSTIIKTRNVGL